MKKTSRIIVRPNKKGTYSVYEKTKTDEYKVVVNTPTVNIPFSIENFGTKRIINLEIPKTNDGHNFVKRVQEIENLVAKQLPGVDFATTIKFKETFPPLIRTHIRITKK